MGDSTHDWVLRRPPLRHVLATRQDMALEYRVRSALEQTDVPVAAQTSLCEDGSVIGVAFCVMKRLDNGDAEGAGDARTVGAASSPRLSASA